MMQHVGQRLANAALSIVYKQAVNWRSPTFKSAKLSTMVATTTAATAGTTTTLVEIALNDVEGAGLTLKTPFNCACTTQNNSSNNRVVHETHRCLHVIVGADHTAGSCATLNAKTPGTCAWASIQVRAHCACMELLRSNNAS